ncbi:hypothetical protein AGMMS49959_19320 [Planctomycetales bacterium]|nr:hypothetical protein AGMMS49959_19320 [Planctomycetales bacterium]
MRDRVVEELHEIRRKLSERWDKMTPAEAAADKRRQINEGLRLLGRPQLPAIKQV